MFLLLLLQLSDAEQCRNTCRQLQLKESTTSEVREDSLFTNNYNVHNVEVLSQCPVFFFESVVVCVSREILFTGMLHLIWTLFLHQ